MAYSDVAPIRKQMTIVMGLLVVGLMAFGLAVSYYKNVLFDRQLNVMRDRNDAIRHSIELARGELEYRASVQYKDAYAKENFNLLRPGEKILILPHQEQARSLISRFDASPEELQALYEQRLRSIPILQHWNLFLFHRDKIDSLKHL